LLLPGCLSPAGVVIGFDNDVWCLCTASPTFARQNGWARLNEHSEGAVDLADGQRCAVGRPRPAKWIVLQRGRLSLPILNAQ